MSNEIMMPSPARRNMLALPSARCPSIGSTADSGNIQPEPTAFGPNIGAYPALRNIHPGPIMPSPIIGAFSGSRNVRPGPTMPGPNIEAFPGFRNVRPGSPMAGPNIEAFPGFRNVRPGPPMTGPNIGFTPSTGNTRPNPTTLGANVGPTVDTDNRPDPTMPPPGVVIVSRVAKKKSATGMRGIVSRYAIIGNVVPKRRPRKVMSRVVRNLETGESSDCEGLNVVPFENAANLVNNPPRGPIITNAARNRHRERLLHEYHLYNPTGDPLQNMRPFLRRRVRVELVNRRVLQDYQDNFTGYGTFSFLTACRVFSLIVLGYFMLQYKDT